MAVVAVAAGVVMVVSAVAMASSAVVLTAVSVAVAAPWVLVVPVGEGVVGAGWAVERAVVLAASWVSLEAVGGEWREVAVG